MILCVGTSPTWCLPNIHQRIQQDPTCKKQSAPFSHSINNSVKLYKEKKMTKPDTWAGSVSQPELWIIHHWTDLEPRLGEPPIVCIRSIRLDKPYYAVWQVIGRVKLEASTNYTDRAGFTKIFPWYYVEMEVWGTYSVCVRGSIPPTTVFFLRIGGALAIRNFSGSPIKIW